MLWCDSVAPLGKPVVPDVYWMLIGSSKASVAAALAQGGRVGRRPVATSSSQLGLADVDDRRAKPIAVDHRPVVAGLEARPR